MPADSFEVEDLFALLQLHVASEIAPAMGWRLERWGLVGYRHRAWQIEQWLGPRVIDAAVAAARAVLKEAGR